MKKSKKIILGLSGISAFAPIAFSAGCGSSKSDNENIDTSNDGGYGRYANDRKADGHYDGAYDKTVKIGVTWSRGRDQWNALSDIIDVFNETMKTELDNIDKGIKVELVNIGSGYNNGNEKIFQSINAQDKNDLINLTFNYPDLASKIATKGMLLNFKDRNPEFSTEQDLFSDQFTSANNQTAEIVNDGSWLIPAAKSTTVLSINAPVLSYILETMESNGVTINLSNYNDIKSKGVSDRSEIVKLWGAARSSADLSSLLTGYTVDESTFSDGKKLLEFANKAQQLFVNSYNGGKPVDANVHVFGIDDIAGLIPTLALASVNGDLDEFYAKSRIQKGNRVIDYRDIKSDSSTMAQKLSDIYNDFRSAFEKGSVVLQGPGQYTSVDEVNHKFAIGLGSTAGYTHNFIDSTNLTNIYTIDGQTISAYKSKATNASLIFKNGKYTNSIQNSTSTSKHDFVLKDASKDAILNQWITKYPTSESEFNLLISTDDSSTISQLDNLASANPNDIVSLGQATKESKTSNLYLTLNNVSNNISFNETTKKYMLGSTELNNVYKVSQKEESLQFKNGKYSNNVVPSTSDNTDHNYKLIDSSKDTLLSSIISKLLPGTYKDAILIVVPSDSKKLANKFKNLTVSNPSDIVSLGLATLDNQPNNKYELFFAYNNVGGKIVNVKQTATTTLQENELMAFDSITKWEDANTKNIVYSQGPSLIGIHVNDKEDKVSKLFVHFLTQHDKIAGKLDDLKPWEYFAKHASYIFPVKGFETTDTSGLKNQFLIKAFDQFKKVASDSTSSSWEAFEEFAGPDSTDFRSKLGAIWQSVYNKINNGDSVTDYRSEIVQNLVSQLGKLLS